MSLQSITPPSGTDGLHGAGGSPLSAMTAATTVGVGLSAVGDGGGVTDGGGTVDEGDVVGLGTCPDDAVALAVAVAVEPGGAVAVAEADGLGDGVALGVGALTTSVPVILVTPTSS